MEGVTKNVRTEESNKMRKVDFCSSPTVTANCLKTFQRALLKTNPIRNCSQLEQSKVKHNTQLRCKHSATMKCSGHNEPNI